MTGAALCRTRSAGSTNYTKTFDFVEERMADSRAQEVGGEALTLELSAGRGVPQGRPGRSFNHHLGRLSWGQARMRQHDGRR
jgi:hypothetical protein